ncbi:DUF4233 domain-containing protein [Frigoribacterium sp. 2-23]|uniref:DUF4233 domain-containing protein n=1 Tax=Frigoribacterium sp. 2-23 TaxID=3415006 RepID=UPI003C6F4649
MTQPLPPAGRGAGRPARPRRRRGAAESLLSIVLVLEAMVLFFLALVVFGRGVLPGPVVLVGLISAIVIMALVSRVLRFGWGLALGWVVQAGLVALGLLEPLMFVVALIFIAIWIFCFVKGRQLDALNRARYPDAV